MQENLPRRNRKPTCPSCREGLIKRVTRDYKIKLPDGKSSTIANLRFEECPKCKDEFFSAEAMERISDKVSAESDSLTSSELKRIREKLQSNMTLLGESLGFGSKTWMRWEKGEQNISRSMGYFVRAMAQFPEVYEWVADRAWRGEEIRPEAKEQSPIKDLERKILKTYLSLSKPDKREELESKTLDEFLTYVFNSPQKKTQPARINSRRGDIQHVDSRFSDFTKLA